MQSTASKALRGTKCHYVSRYSIESIKIFAEWQASCQGLSRGKFNAGCPILDFVIFKKGRRKENVAELTGTHLVHRSLTI